MFGKSVHFHKTILSSFFDWHDLMYWIELHTTAYNNVIMPCDDAMFSLCIIIPKKKRRRKRMLAKKYNVVSLFALTYLFPVHPFSTPWKHQKTPGFLMFSRGRERMHWMDEVSYEFNSRLSNVWKTVNRMLLIFRICICCMIFRCIFFSVFFFLFFFSKR